MDGRAPGPRRGRLGPGPAALAAPRGDARPSRPSRSGTGGYDGTGARDPGLLGRRRAEDPFAPPTVRPVTSRCSSPRPAPSWPSASQTGSPLTIAISRLDAGGTRLPVTTPERDLFVADFPLGTHNVIVHHHVAPGQCRLPVPGRGPSGAGGAGTARPPPADSGGRRTPPRWRPHWQTRGPWPAPTGRRSSARSQHNPAPTRARATTVPPTTAGPGATSFVRSVARTGTTCHNPKSADDTATAHPVPAGPPTRASSTPRKATSSTSTVPNGMRTPAR